MSPVRIRFHRLSPEASHWLRMGVISVILHFAMVMAAVVLPKLIPSSSKFPDVYAVDLVSLPAGLPGPPARGPRTAAPPPPPKPAPKKKAAPVKIPEQPKKVTEKKPVKKAPPKPKPEPKKEAEVEKTPEPVPVEPAPEPEVEGPVPEETPGGDSPDDAASGGVGFGSGAGTGGGGSGRLDDTSFEYGWYLTRMVSVLRNNWARPLAGSRLREAVKAVVFFRIRRDGTLTDIALEESSGDSTLDSSALRCVHDSNPLPPLPYQYGRDSLGVHFYFELEPD